MPFGIIILIRVLFAACMVFIIGYVFGSFSKNSTLVTITKVASILAIVLFISANVLSFRFGRTNPNFYRGYSCGYYQKDTTATKTLPELR